MVEQALNVRVSVFDEHFTIESDTLELVEKAAQSVEKTMQYFAQNVKMPDEKRLAILVAIHFAHELLKQENFHEMFCQRTTALIRQIEREHIEP